MHGESSVIERITLQVCSCREESVPMVYAARQSDSIREVFHDLFMARMRHCAVHGHPEGKRAHFLHKAGTLKIRETEHGEHYVLPMKAECDFVKAVMGPLGVK